MDRRLKSELKKLKTFNEENVCTAIDHLVEQSPGKRKFADPIPACDNVWYGFAIFPI